MRIFLENNEPEFLLKCTSFKNRIFILPFDDGDAFEDVENIFIFIVGQISSNL